MAHRVNRRSSVGSAPSDADRSGLEVRARSWFVADTGLVAALLVRLSAAEGKALVTGATKLDATSPPWMQQ